MTLQQEVEKLKREKECLELRLESSNIELEGLRKAYMERCRISEEEKKELQRRLKIASLQKEHAGTDIQQIVAELQTKDSMNLELQKSDTELQKEKEIKLLASKLAQVNSRLAECETQLKAVIRDQPRISVRIRSLREPGIMLMHASLM